MQNSALNLHTVTTVNYVIIVSTNANYFANMSIYSQFRSKFGNACFGKLQMANRNKYSCL